MLLISSHASQFSLFKKATAWNNAQQNMLIASAWSILTALSATSFLLLNCTEKLGHGLKILIASNPYNKYNQITPSHLLSVCQALFEISLERGQPNYEYWCKTDKLNVRSNLPLAIDLLVASNDKSSQHRETISELCLQNIKEYLHYLRDPSLFLGCTGLVFHIKTSEKNFVLSTLSMVKVAIT